MCSLYHIGRSCRLHPDELALASGRAPSTWREGHLEESIQEREVRSGLLQGGSLRSVVVDTTRTEDGPQYQAYLRPSWRDRHVPLATWEGRSERKYRDIGRLFRLIRDDFRFAGAIAVHLADDAALRRKPGFELQPGR